MRSPSTIQIGLHEQLRIEDIVFFARDKKTQVLLSSSPDFKNRIDANRQYIDQKIQDNADIYGVTTGFGDSSRNRLETSLAYKLQRNLYAYHGCGVGNFLSEEACAASLLVRFNCITRGYSGVSWQLIESLFNLISHRLFPAMPAQGSVGASGDLTPLSYIAACLAGERTCYREGLLISSEQALREANISPYTFRSKETLAIMNGTSVMTGIAALAWSDAREIAHYACALTALLVECLESRTTPFLKELHEVKPHAGQQYAASVISEYLTHTPERATRKNAAKDVIEGTRAEHFRLQDSYSIRCAPHVIGVLFDVLTWTRTLIETELNSVNDNPVIRDDVDAILNGGHFFGGHIAAACDALKTATANVLNLIDKQMAILLDNRLNDHRFSNNLVAVHRLHSECYIHHGFKAMQISLSALTAEALKTSLPMSIFSRPTECLNQDVVSMGTIAARDLTNIIDMGQSVVAIYAMALRQATFLLHEENHKYNAKWSDKLRGFVEHLAQHSTPVIEDRALDSDIVRMCDALFKKEQV